MDNLEEALLSEVHPLFPPFSVVLKVDRFFCREIIRTIGHERKKVKDVHSVCIVVYDTQVVVFVNSFTFFGVIPLPGCLHQ